jgi:acyl-CoA thioester hydrolase
MADGKMLGTFITVDSKIFHQFPVQVYWEDTDAGGIVYYANYLKFTERARTDMLRGLRINQQEMMIDEGANFVVRSCEIEYLLPAKMDDELNVVTCVTDLRGASLEMQQDICRGSDIIVTTKVRVACLGEGGRPQRLSSAINEKFNAILGSAEDFAHSLARED